MHEIYDLGDGNTLESFTNKNILDSQTFFNIHKRCEKRSWVQQNHLNGAQRTVRPTEI